jgi:hypothetical protein
VAKALLALLNRQHDFRPRQIFFLKISLLQSFKTASRKPITVAGQHMICTYLGGDGKELITPKECVFGESAKPNTVPKRKKFLLIICDELARGP